MPRSLIPFFSPPCWHYLEGCWIEFVESKCSASKLTTAYFSVKSHRLDGLLLQGRLHIPQHEMCNNSHVHDATFWAVPEYGQREQRSATTTHTHTQTQRRLGKILFLENQVWPKCDLCIFSLWMPNAALLITTEAHILHVYCSVAIVTMTRCTYFCTSCAYVRVTRCQCRLARADAHWRPGAQCGKWANKLAAQWASQLGPAATCCPPPQPPLTHSCSLWGERTSVWYSGTSI